MYVSELHWIHENHVLFDVVDYKCNGKANTTTQMCLPSVCHKHAEFVSQGLTYWKKEEQEDMCEL